MVKRFETGMSENNLPNWDDLFCVKEFIQNVVYAKSVLHDQIDIRYENGKAIIENSPSGFTKGKLLIGESEQRNVIGAPGNWGEGIKAAMCVGRRLGLSIELQTNGFKVTPELEPSSIDPLVRCLVFYIEDNDINEGTKVKIECSQDTLEKAKSYFAVLQGVEEDIVKSSGIIPNVEEGSIFVNGVKVTETNSLYSYNLTNADLMNRDRTTVDMNKVKQEVRSIISDVSEEVQATEILKGIVEEDDLLESQAGVNPWATKDSIWKKSLQALFGKKIAISTGTDSDALARHKKFRLLPKIPNNWDYFFNYNLEVYKTNDLKGTDNHSLTKIKPKGEESSNLGWCKRLIKLYYADYGKVKIAEKVVDEYNNLCDGLYDPNEDVIWLRRELLSSKEECFKTLLHETIHRTTGASDNTTRFTTGWESACWGILQRGKK